MVATMDFYRQQSPLTDPGELSPLFDGLPRDVGALAEVVRGGILHRDETTWRFGFEVSREHEDEPQTRYAQEILRLMGSWNGRELPDRFVGTCRDFALLLCSMLRHIGVPARLRVGFGGYFVKDFFDDHWVVEYWTDEHGWRLADAQVAGDARAAYGVGFDVMDVPRDQFVVGGAAWIACRAGEADPDAFGVHGAGLKGMWEIQGSVIRDLASLNRVETLPWDNWGLIPREYQDLGDADVALPAEAAPVSAAGGPLERAARRPR